MRKRVLCYGDSNTYGSRPDAPGRWDESVRWPMRLQALLGDEWMVVEEGCGGRTTVWEDPIEEDKNGKAYLRPCIHSHRPLDVVIIALGINDLKARFSLTANDVAQGAGTLVRIVKGIDYGSIYKAPKILLVAPAPLHDEIMSRKFARMYAEDALEKSKKLAAEYKIIAEELGVEYLDAGLYVEIGEDGLHYTAESHKRLGEAIAEKIREMEL